MTEASLEDTLFLFGKVLQEWQGTTIMKDARLRQLAAAFTTLQSAQEQLPTIQDVDRLRQRPGRTNFLDRMLVHTFQERLRENRLDRKWVAPFNAYIMKVIGEDRHEALNNLALFVWRDQCEGDEERAINHPIAIRLQREAQTLVAAECDSDHTPVQHFLSFYHTYLGEMGQDDHTPSERLERDVTTLMHYFFLQADDMPGDVTEYLEEQYGHTATGHTLMIKQVIDIQYMLSKEAAA